MKKAFTLTELMVVITILAILGTMAFISLQWYVEEAEKHIRIETDYRTYYTENYYESGNCIEFTDTYNKDIEICGNYTIIK